MSSWLNREGRTWRVQWDSALALWRGQRCGAPHASKVCPFLLPLSLGVAPFLFAFCVLWRPHCERFSLLPLLRRDRCRQGDAPHDLFPLFASSLCQVESSRAVQLANSVHRSLSACNRSNLLIPSSGFLPFRVRGRSRCVKSPAMMSANFSRRLS